MTVAKKLYEFAIIVNEKKDTKGNVTEPAELLKRGDFLAADDAQAQMIAAREIPQEHMEHLERVTLAVRPF